MRLRIKALLASACLLFATAAPAQEINFGIISTDRSAAIRSMWEPFIEDMQKEMFL